MAKPVVHSIVYTCQASKPMSEVDLKGILDVARVKNVERGITGKLFYRNQHFFQILEGEEATVQALVASIKRDPRQSGLTILDEGKQERLFEDWSMDFQLLEASKNIDSVELPVSALPSELDNAQIRLRKLLITFMSRSAQVPNAETSASQDSDSVVHSLIYTCMSRYPLSEADIQDILEVSRRNNAQKGITGILFYRKNQFLQVLEGDEKKVHDLVDTISRDPRQKGLAILEEGKQLRLFGQWAMDFKLLDTSQEEDNGRFKFIPLSPEMNKAQLRLRKLLVSFMNR